MKNLTLTIASAAAILAAPLAASAAPWQSINQRQQNLEQRIEQGVSSGELTRPEAARMKNQFRDLARLETRYRRSGSGLSASERRDLNQKFDRLSQRLQAQKHDGQERPRY